jgi:U2-associated protein SR140
VRHAWRYRSLFETGLKKQKVFETLGRVDKELGWGRLKAEKWKRSVQSVLSLWEGWCLFPQASQEAFVDGFLNPPLSEAEKRAAEREETQRKEREQGEPRRTKSNSKWRSVEERGDAKMEVGRPGDDEVMEDADDLDGEEMADEDDEDEVALSDVDGEPMDDSSDEEDTRAAMQSSPLPDAAHPRTQQPAAPDEHKSPPVKRQRPRAVDMFADDSGGE